MLSRILAVLIGYIFGCFLTAELVAARFAGKRAAELGETGNPGMANIMASLGFVPGILTLVGDLGKCILAGIISYSLFKNTGWIVVLYAGLGCTLCHNFPVWRKFRRGKGVATISMAIALYSFWAGLGANLIGMVVTFATKYLCIGGPAIPLSFMVMMFVRRDMEAAAIAGVLSVLSLLAHGQAILKIRSGETKQTDVLGAIRRKITRAKGS